MTNISAVVLLGSMFWWPPCGFQKGCFYGVGVVKEPRYLCLVVTAFGVEPAEAMVRRVKLRLATVAGFRTGVIYPVVRFCVGIYLQLPGGSTVLHRDVLPHARFTNCV